MGNSRSSRRSKQILDAAARLIARYGYDKTTVEEIAHEAGVSKGAIYLHFKSKEALFEALLFRDADALVDRYLELVDADPGGLSIFTMYRYGLQVLEDFPLLKAIYTRDKRITGDYVRHLRDTSGFAQVANFTFDFVSQLQAAGLIRADLDAGSVAHLLMALRYGLLTMDDYTPGGRAPSIAELGDTLAEMLAGGLAPRAGEVDEQAARQALRRLMDVSRQFVAQRQAVWKE